MEADSGLSTPGKRGYRTRGIARWQVADPRSVRTLPGDPSFLRVLQKGWAFASLFVFLALTGLSYLRFSPFLVSAFKFLVFLFLPYLLSPHPLKNFILTETVLMR